MSGSLENHDQLKAILAQGERILNANRQFQTIAPAALARVSRVANLKSGILVIHAQHGAAANKLGQMSRYLIDEIQKKGVECNGIEVRVQASVQHEGPLLGHTKPISEQALTSLGNAAQEMGKDSTLRGSIERLIERAARLPKGG